MGSGSSSLKRKYDVFSASGSGSGPGNMASGSCSSSAVPTLKWKYDVFLSFRGEDTRYNFVDHLHTALVQRGIFVFKDDNELKTGEPISLELLKAISESRYAVVVFSENYANSSWCLAELAKIMKCHKEMGQKVIPVFYHVDPSDIRGQKNEVAVFFQQHEERFREKLDKVTEWRDALTAAANLSGHHISKTIKEGESSYISKIVEKVLADRRLSYMESNLVGIHSHMNTLNSLLRTQENDKVRIIGIHGMGGIGKTTIAKALFTRIAYNFEGSCFVNGVRENSKRDMCALQEKVLREILITNHNFNLQDSQDGANMIRARFVHKKVLIVLDDVDDCKQLEFLSATRESFGPGSRIIITTRNKQLLFGANAKYEPDCLQMDQALELFSKHAFKRDCPPEGYEVLSCRAIRYARYLPLAVKVLGSFFRGKEADVWESAFNRLAKAPNVEIFDSLKLSFDGLEASEKKIFLDIACFFKGKRVREVTKVLESCGFDPQIGLSVLIEKSLITISRDNEICMHDLIQEMGWQIAREGFPNSRLWHLNDIRVSLKNNRKHKKIEAIVVSEEKYEEHMQEGFSANVFEHMKNLRLLYIRGRFTSSEPTFFPDNLRWLSWSRYPFSSLSMTDMSELVGLEVVGGTLNQFWKGQKIMPNLKILKLQQLDYLTTFPDVTEAPNIEKLFVWYCKNLVEIHKSLGSHKRILMLDVYSCERLKHLPSRFEMKSLMSLSVMNCPSLERFPDVSPCMVNFSYIYLDCCCSIEGLLSSLGYLCKEYPEKHGRRENLVEDDTKALESLSTSNSLQTVTNICFLITLDLTCRPMESGVFQKNLQSFSYVGNLYLSGNNNLIQLPTSISHLSFLRDLRLNDCHQLQILHGLPSSIQKLEANNCCSLEKIDDLSEEYYCWRDLSFVNCQKLLKDEDSKRYLEKMLRQSFLTRCVVIDHEISFVIPGNEIPSWFTQEQHGYNIELTIPPKCNNQIKGIAICAVFLAEWQGTNYFPSIYCHFKKDGVYFPWKECTNAIPAGEKGNTWISYKPCSSFRDFQREEWSGGILYIQVSPTPVRCAACLIYKEGMESNQ